MDDRAFIVAFVARETARINLRLKELLEATQEPTAEQRDAIAADIDQTLIRMQTAVSHILEQAYDPNQPETKKPWLN